MIKIIFKIFKTSMLTILLLLAALTIATIAFMQQAKFGKQPNGERLKRIQASPNYKNGEFQNISPTPALTEGVSYYAVLKDFMFGDYKRKQPIDNIPSVKTDLLQLNPQEEVLVWFGHSSYFIQSSGKTILVDPVFSGAASPLEFTTKAFKGTDGYKPEDFPEIDYLFISHDHWDHLDYETIIKMKSKIKQVFCGLGTGAHFERWGFDLSKIHELDWNDSVNLNNGFAVHAVTARHFSGRGFSRNKALWTSFVLQTPTLRLFIGGDSGYDKHFADIGAAYGPFDLAILENGQYDKSWKYIHMLPDQVLQAAIDLKAKQLFPVHSSKFNLGNHAWDDPLKTITELNKSIHLPLITPIIGEQVNLKDSTHVYKEWWTGIN